MESSLRSFGISFLNLFLKDINNILNALYRTDLGGCVNWTFWAISVFPVAEWQQPAMTTEWRQERPKAASESKCWLSFWSTPKDPPKIRWNDSTPAKFLQPILFYTSSHRFFSTFFSSKLELKPHFPLFFSCFLSIPPISFPTNKDPVFFRFYCHLLTKSCDPLGNLWYDNEQIRHINSETGKAYSRMFRDEKLLLTNQKDRSVLRHIPSFARLFCPHLPLESTSAV